MPGWAGQLEQIVLQVHIKVVQVLHNAVQRRGLIQRNSLDLGLVVYRNKVHRTRLEDLRGRGSILICAVQNKQGRRPYQCDFRQGLMRVCVENLNFASVYSRKAHEQMAAQAKSEFLLRLLNLA